ncbi:hypothetical protein CI238_05979 [Colletotrichum incanum]|uniref:Uncharacterized protein n=1 Tax=Colletotrichum incanum TaxID=1573173 RepID=A0A161W8R5_COLIC|nr:hypothetical protein CI238_05979 [Colletotrichum incanum]
MTETEDQQLAPIGHTYGFWRLPGSLPGNSDWDAPWICESQVRFARLPERNLARQHGGWGHGIEEINDEHEPKSPRVNAEETGFTNHFPHPAMSLPTPILEFDFRVAVRFTPEIIMVRNEKTIELAREVCGSWSGSLGSGSVVSGGHDLDRTKLDTRTTHKIITAFKLQTSEEDPASLEMGTRGFLGGPPDVLHQTAYRLDGGARIDPRKYHYRMFINLTTTDERVYRVG